MNKLSKVGNERHFTYPFFFYVNQNNILITFKIPIALKDRYLALKSSLQLRAF